MRAIHSFLAAASAAFVVALATSVPASATQHPGILLTGFEPFDGDPVNPSWEAIRLLDGQTIEGYPIHCVRLPVDYRQVQTILDRLIPTERPAAYVAFGEDAADQEVDLELDAVDHVDPRIPDSGGFDEKATHLRKGGAPVYHSTLPLDALETLLSAAGVTVRRSSDAGSYVCDFTFYNARFLIEQNHLDTKMGFIHLPAVGHPWSAEQLQAVGRDITTVVARSLNGSSQPLALPSLGTAPVGSSVAVDQIASVTSQTPPAPAPTIGLAGAVAQGE